MRQFWLSLGCALGPLVESDVLEPVGAPRYPHYLAMMAQPVGDRARRHAVAEHLAPAPDADVGRHYRRPGQEVSPVHQLEQQVCALLADPQVAHLVYHQQAAVLVEAHPARQRALLAGRREVGHEARAVGEVDLAVGQGRLVAYGDRQVGLADAGAADQHDVAPALHERQGRQLLHLAPGDAGLEGPVEVGERLHEREVRHPQAPRVVGPQLGCELGVGHLQERPHEVALPRAHQPHVIGHQRRHLAQPERLHVREEPVQGAGLHRGRHSEPPIDPSSSRLAAAAAAMSSSPNQRLPSMASA